MLAPVCLLLPFRFLSQKDRGRQKAAAPFEEVKHPEPVCFFFFFSLSLYAKFSFQSRTAEGQRTPRTLARRTGDQEPGVRNLQAVELVLN